MDMVIDDFLLHVLVVQPPDTLFIPLHRVQDDVVAAVLQRMGEAHIGRALDQHVVSPGAEHVQRGNHAAQHAVLIADVLLLQPGNPVMGALPADNGVKISLGEIKIAEGRMLHPADNGFLNRGADCEIHVRHPHGNRVKALLRAGGAARRPDGVPGNRVLSAAVRHCFKIIFHILILRMR